MCISFVLVYISRIDDMCIINTILLFDLFTKLNLSYKNSSFLLQSTGPQVCEPGLMICNHHSTQKLIS